jgi:hypothetical protein
MIGLVGINKKSLFANCSILNSLARCGVCGGIFPVSRSVVVHSSYTTTTDPLYYTLRFIDGLPDDIKSVVLVQRPADLDTACVLAALHVCLLFLSIVHIQIHTRLKWGGYG